MTEGGLEGAGATGLQAFVGGALKRDILDTALGAELTLGIASAFGIDYEDVGLDNIESGYEVDDSPTLVNIGFLNGLDILHHEEALLLREHGLAMLILEVGGIGADADIEVSKLGGLLEEFYVTAMEEVITSRNKNFFIHCFLFRV